MSTPIIIGDPPPPPPRVKVLGFTLVPDAARWRKWWSMRWMGVSAGLQLVGQSLDTVMDPLRAGWSIIPSAWLANLPAWLPSLFGWAAVGALACAGASRLIQQRVTLAEVNDCLANRCPSPAHCAPTGTCGKRRAP